MLSVGTEENTAWCANRIAKLFAKDLVVKIDNA